MTKFKGDFLLLIAAIIFGTAFVAQKLGMQYIGPFTFGAVRFLLGALVLMLFIALQSVIQRRKQMLTDNGHLKKCQLKHLFLGGGTCGAALFIAASFLQFGLRYTNAGKAGFITALYILLVPLLGLILHKKVHKLVWAGVFLAIIGLYLLCVKKDFSVETGDIIVLGGSLFWAIQILSVDAFVEKVDAVKLSCVQFSTAALLSAIAAFAFESPRLDPILASAAPILYNAIVVIGIAFTLQIVGQKHTSPASAALILSSESVFAVISGVIILNETLGFRELVGCLFMFSAIIISQLGKIPGNIRIPTPRFSKDNFRR